MVSCAAHTPWPVVPGAGSLMVRGTHLTEGRCRNNFSSFLQGVEGSWTPFPVPIPAQTHSGQRNRRTPVPPCLRPLSPPRDHGGQVPARLWVATTLALRLGERSHCFLQASQTLIIPCFFGIWSCVLFSLAPVLKSHYLGHLSSGHIRGSLSQMSSSGKDGFRRVPSWIFLRSCCPSEEGFEPKRACGGVAVNFKWCLSVGSRAHPSPSFGGLGTADPCCHP